MKEKLRTAKGRSSASQRWLKRQLSDPYVRDAKKEGYRSRSAYKLLEIDKRFRLLKRDMKIIDLGAAPGGWSQVAAAKIGTKGKVVALDLLPLDPIPGVEILLLDFLAPEAPGRLIECLGGTPDLILSDMSPNTTGHKRTDHLRIMAVAEAAADFAIDVLKPGGAFVTKVFQGGAGAELVAKLKIHFSSVRHVKPPASRAQSAEVYVVAQGFKANC